ncbi:CHASE2 domain-containing protein [Pseudomonas stutzeri]|uniref:Nucleotide cyclase n=1 Tax=Stutzerimonas stutzeri KOS6 TaxID=1218352 RepID=A0A061JW18_STUST|nr:CHASE2 domain-containing protein [Stutzerimonas stutzeri]EWC42749.1 nucleotide cyclase [Stutzerimonas stutzeri KOS6]MBK3866633.1 CHASE2 domain-containing protein [Stutzerimonas stutzeri]
MPALLQKIATLRTPLALLAILLDPFGLTTATDVASSRLLNQLQANSYADSARRQIAVVIIDDAFLRERQSHWPLPYSEQSKLFRQLLAYRPAAVMVDLMYSYDHSRGRSNDSSQLLANVFERYRAADVPLYLANSGATESNVLPAFANVSQPALVSWSGYGDQYPLAAETAYGWMDSAAFALYRSYCAQHGCAPLPNTPQKAAEHPPMALQWGRDPASEQRRVSDVSQCATAPGFWQEVLARLAQAVFWRINAPAEALCPYHLTITASALATTVPQERALLRELLGDRLVLVGASINSAEDLVSSPVHGKLPGVYAHAMALDNLIQYGQDYIAAPAQLFGTDIDVLDLLEVAFILALLWFESTRAGLSPRCRLTVALGAAIGLLMLSGLLYQLRVTPVNILGLLLLIGLLMPKKPECTPHNPACTRKESSCANP